MVARALKRNRWKALILTAVCLAIGLGSMACGGGGSTVVDPVPSPGFSLSSTALNFAKQGVDTAGTPLTASLTNIGDATLSLSKIQVTGPNSGDFTLTNNCGSSLAASAQCTLAVTFAPSAAGTRTASVGFTDNAAGSLQTLSLSGTGTAPGVGLSATTLAFGSQPVGTSSPAQTLTLTNNGNSVLGITSLVVTGNNPGDFPETTTCAGTVAAGGSCTTSLTFTPTASGSRSATLTIADNASDSPQTISLTGTGASAAPAVSLSASSLAFASQAVSTTSAAQAIVLTNTGNASLTLTSISVTGANPSDFAQTNTCGSSLAANGTCAINVTFTPAAPGTRTAAVTIADSATGSPQGVSLTGTGSGPVVGLSLSSLTFGSQSIGVASPAQTVTLSNLGNASLSITSIIATGADPGDFSVTNTCGSSVAAGGNCAISVTFTPAAAGTRTAAVSISDNAAGSPQAVGLTGAGLSGQISLSPSSLTFTSQNVGTTSAGQTVTLSNTGNASLTITSISITGANAGDFFETNNCGSSLAQGTNCAIQVTFTPTAPLTRTASIGIADNLTGSPQTVSLTGTGAGPMASATPSSLVFGNQAVNSKSSSQTVTLTNSGNASLTITGISITGANGADFSQTNTCGSAVAAGGGCSIAVTFTPSASGTRTASLSIADNATAGSPQAVSLTGTGTGGTVGLSATALSFGNQAVGTSSTAQILTLTNGGSSTVTISGIQATGANSGDFGQSNDCGSSVAANGSCTINVTFLPVASGSRTATLSVNDNASGSPQTASLTGTGTAPLASLSPGSFVFANQPVAISSSAQTFSLSNTGNVALDIASIGFTGANAGDFSQTTTCGATLGANSSCIIAVLFTPAASGSRSASLTVTDNNNGASGAAQSSTLSGAGTHDVILSWTASVASGVAGYYVYRGTAAGGESSTPLNSTPSTGTTYVDANVTPGTTYYYVVTAVGSDGVQSAASNETEATVPTT